MAVETIEVTPLQKALRAARWVKRECTIPSNDPERFQVVIRKRSYASLRRLARALDDLNDN
jgi:hypothetical protein